MPHHSNYNPMSVPWQTRQLHCHEHIVLNAFGSGIKCEKNRSIHEVNFTKCIIKDKIFIFSPTKSILFFKLYIYCLCHLSIAMLLKPVPPNLEQEVGNTLERSPIYSNAKTDNSSNVLTSCVGNAPLNDMKPGKSKSLLDLALLLLQSVISKHSWLSQQCCTKLANISLY